MIELDFLKFYKKEVSSMRILKGWLGSKFFLIYSFMLVSSFLTIVPFLKFSHLGYLMMGIIINALISYFLFRYQNKVLRDASFLKLDEKFGGSSKSLAEEQDKIIGIWIELKLDNDVRKLDNLILRLRERINESRIIPVSIIGGAFILVIFSSFLSDYARFISSKEELIIWYGSIFRISFVCVVLMTMIRFCFDGFRPLNNEKIALRILENYRFKNF